MLVAANNVFELLASRDATHRDRLEALFLELETHDREQVAAHALAGEPTERLDVVRAARGGMRSRKSSW